MRDPDPYVMYTIVRRSLNLSAGKVGAQCQHALDYLTREVDRLRSAATLDVEKAKDMENLTAWRYGEEHAKIILGATDQEFEAVKQVYPQHFLVIDHGLTQVAPNTETCLGLWPMRKSSRARVLKSLKLF